jgi:hypothetical protein
MSEAFFQSIAAPPERHADRVIAAMLRGLAQKRAQVTPAMQEVLHKSKDGTPRAQLRMAERLRKAGAMHVQLFAGTRGRYKMLVLEITGWNPGTDREIGVNDLIPEKPWLACWLTAINGRRNRCASVPVLFITHHAISRAAQRHGLRTPEHILNGAKNIFNAMLWELHEAKYAEEFYETPPQGRQMHVGANVTVVLQRHRTRAALVVATMLMRDEEGEGNDAGGDAGAARSRPDGDQGADRLP